MNIVEAFPLSDPTNPIIYIQDNKYAATFIFDFHFPTNPIIYIQVNKDAATSIFESFVLKSAGRKIKLFSCC